MLSEVLAEELIADNPTPLETTPGVTLKTKDLRDQLRSLKAEDIKGDQMPI
jgi:hypothetical protein